MEMDTVKQMAWQDLGLVERYITTLERVGMNTPTYFQQFFLASVRFALFTLSTGFTFYHTVF